MTGKQIARWGVGGLLALSVVGWLVWAIAVAAWDLKRTEEIALTANLVTAFATVATLVVGVAAITAWRAQQRADAFHQAAVKIVRAAWRSRRVLGRASHAGAVDQFTSVIEDPLADPTHQRMQDELVSVHADLAEAESEAKVIWDDEPLLGDLQMLSTAVASMQHALAVYAYERSGKKYPRVMPTPLYVNWIEMVRGDLTEWDRVRPVIENRIARVEARLAPHIATRKRREEREMPKPLHPLNVEVPKPTPTEGS